MNGVHSNSLQVRLATRLGLLFLLATLILAGAFVYLSFNLVESLSRRDLFRLAEELAEEIEDEGEFEDINRFIERGWLNEDTRYLVLSNEGKVLASSDEVFREAVMAPNFVLEPTRSFRLDGFGNPPQRYFGLVTREWVDGEHVVAVVAEPDRPEQELLDLLLNDVMLKAAWILPVFILVTLLVGVRAIRGGLQPLRTTAKEAAAINPEAISVRLGTDALPSEISPLVKAVNKALDRLEEGFETQRRFTANAAHELRTPLTIVTGALEGMEDSDQVKKLRQDVARMNRLVEQLLHVARLDGLTMDASNTVDLGQVAHQVLELTAPLAIRAGKEIELFEPDEKVKVMGNQMAMEDALRNLVENAVAHGSPGTLVEVRVSLDGSVCVCDQGPGIPADERAHLFDRFWRGRKTKSETGGAGLGLSIVQEIMKLHDGSVSLEERAAGGSCFCLHFREAK